METGVIANEGGLGLHPAATLNLDLLQGIERGKAAIGQGFIGQRPKAFARLEFGRVRRQKEQMDTVRDA